ncbi:MAG: AAA family ATPase [Polyangiales bacterium]
MIESVRLVNFRKHVDTTVPLTQFTLLVGDNGSGKTSVLQAVHLAWLASTRDRKDVFAAEYGLATLRRQGATPMEIVLRGVESETAWSCALSAPSEEVAALRVRHEPTDSKVERGEMEFPDDIGEVLSKLSAAFLRFEASRLAEPSTSADEAPRIESDGYGLATVLQWILGQDPERFLAIVAALRRVVPEVAAVRIQRREQRRTRTRTHTLDGQEVAVTEPERFIAEEVSIRFADSDWLPAHAVSEGTLLALGVLTLLHAPDPPRVVLLDDVDRALHPRAQGELVAMLREVLRQSPRTQILATSHSPYMADHFSPDAVVVVSRPDGGPTVARRLSEHPDRKLLEAMTTGEFLHASGSGWYWR